MSTYNESLEQCRKLRDQYNAELNGLISAEWSAVCLPYWSKDPDLQAAFARGHQRGIDQLTIEKAMKAKQEEAPCLSDRT